MRAHDPAGRDVSARPVTPARPETTGAEQARSETGAVPVGATGVGPTGAAATILDLQHRAGNAAATRAVQRMRCADPDHGHESEPIQRSAVNEVLRSSGSPLAGPVRQDMEARLGADFSDVRLHTGALAERSTAEVDARAFTSGSHVVIGRGGSDRHTLAHELTHVIQQRSGPVAGTDNGHGQRVSDPGDAFERAAEANANRVMGAPSREQPLAAARAGERRHPQNPARPHVGGGSIAGKEQPAVQRMTNDEYAAKVKEKSNQEHISWSDDEWRSRFTRWLIDERGLSTENMQEHVQKVTPEALDTLLDDFGSKALEFQKAESSHADKMIELEGELKWDGASFPEEAIKKLRLPRAMSRRKDFARFLRGELPNPQKMNCWEAVLFAAHQQNLVDAGYINDAIYRDDAEAAPVFAQKILNSPAGRLVAEDGELAVNIDLGMKIPKGYVVIFGAAAHVALSTGNTRKNKENAAQTRYGDDGHEIYELDKGTKGVEATTIEDVLTNSAYSKSLTWGPLPSLDKQSGQPAPDEGQ
ncbi:eCIS core domain-containing protein [Micromonospora sp. NPDC003241]